LLDPGLGFGTNSWQNVEILNGLQPVKQLGFPLLVGPSRKSFIGNLLQKPVSERVSGTAAATAISVLYGADILRLHDVKFMKEFLFMTDLLKN
jgi:dihydropteroate synthase